MGVAVLEAAGTPEGWGLTHTETADGLGPWSRDTRAQGSERPLPLALRLWRTASVAGVGPRGTGGPWAPHQRLPAHQEGPQHRAQRGGLGQT